MIEINSKKTAVIVIDIQKEFCSMEGFGAKTWGHDVSHFEGVIEKIKDFINKAEVKELDVLYTQTIYDPDKMSKALIKKLGSFVGNYAAPNSEGIEFHKITPPKEKVFVKYGFSAFTNKDFHEYLKEKGIEILILIGFNTNICVEATARDAIDLGFYPIILKDLCGTPTFLQNHEKETLFLFDILFGSVIESREFLEIVNRGGKNE